MPDDQEGAPKLPLTPTEIRVRLDALPRNTVYDLRNRCLLELMYGCALTIEEAVALDVADIDMTRTVVVLVAAKHGRDRTAALAATVQEAVRNYLPVRRTHLKGPDHGALLLSHLGKRLAASSAYRCCEELNG